MARKKAGPSRMDLRREAEAVEAKEKDEEEKDDDEDEDEDEEEEGDGEAVDEEAAGGDDDEDDDDEDAPKKKKKKVVVKKVAAVKKPAAKRTRTPKEVRMKAVWVVFDNGSKRVGVFQFNEKKQAEKLLDQKIEEKKTTFFLQLVKEPMEVVEVVKEEKPKKKK